MQTLYQPEASSVGFVRKSCGDDVIPDRSFSTILRRLANHAGESPLSINRSPTTSLYPLHNNSDEKYYGNVAHDNLCIKSPTSTGSSGSLKIADDGSRNVPTRTPVKSESSSYPTSSQSRAASTSPRTNAAPPIGMFAAPHIGANALPAHSSANLPLPPAPPAALDGLSPFHPANAEAALKQELNSRFLASSDRSLPPTAAAGGSPAAASLGPSPFLRAEMHQHMHQHQHQHQHMHQYYAAANGLPGAPPGSSAHAAAAAAAAALPPLGLCPPPHAKPGLSIGSAAPPGISAFDLERAKLLDKGLMPKFESPFYRPPGLAGLGPAAYPGLTPGALTPGGLLPPPLGSSPGSSLHGAFQPKGLPGTGSLHHTQLLMSLRDKERASHALPQTTPETSSPSHSASAGSQSKKSGKWCAVHVQVAWQIYHQQQKQNAEGKSSNNNSGSSNSSDRGSPKGAGSGNGAGGGGEPLRPPSHLAGPTLSGAGLHRPGESNPLSQHGSLLPPPGATIRSPFESGLAGPLPGAPLPGGLLTPGSLGPRYGLPPPGYARPGHFNQLTGLSNNAFGGLANIGHQGDRSASSALGNLDRLQRTPSSFPTPPHSKEERDSREDPRDGPPARDSSLSDEARATDSSERARSRSRSPLGSRSGAVDARNSRPSSGTSAHSGGAREVDRARDAEKRSPDVGHSGAMSGARDPMRPPPDPLALGAYGPGMFSSAALMERAKMLGLPPYAMDRGAAHLPPGMVNPFDRSLELRSLEMQREMERERLFSGRFQPPPLGSLMDQERMRDHELLMRERAQREFSERLHLQRLSELERAKLVSRPDMLMPPLGLHPRPLSPPGAALNGHAKPASSPSASSTAGAPPPLVPSTAAPRVASPPQPPKQSSPSNSSPPSQQATDLTKEVKVATGEQQLRPGNEVTEPPTR